MIRASRCVWVEAILGLVLRHLGFMQAGLLRSIPVVRGLDRSASIATVRQVHKVHHILRAEHELGFWLRLAVRPLIILHDVLGRGLLQLYLFPVGRLDSDFKVVIAA
mgnify:CR=1 FL=1